MAPAVLVPAPHTVLTRRAAVMLSSLGPRAARVSVVAAVNCKFCFLDIAPMYPLNRVESTLYVSSIGHEVLQKNRQPLQAGGEGCAGRAGDAAGVSTPQSS